MDPYILNKIQNGLPYIVQFRKAMGAFLTLSKQRNEKYMKNETIHHIREFIMLNTKEIMKNLSNQERGIQKRENNILIGKDIFMGELLLNDDGYDYLIDAQSKYLQTLCQNKEISVPIKQKHIKSLIKTILYKQEISEYTFTEEEKQALENSYISDISIKTKFDILKNMLKNHRDKKISASSHEYKNKKKIIQNILNKKPKKRK